MAVESTERVSEREKKCIHVVLEWTYKLLILHFLYFLYKPFISTLQYLPTSIYIAQYERELVVSTHTVPGKELGLQQGLKVRGIWILETVQLVQAFLDELNPARSVGAHSTESDGLSAYHQPLLSSCHSSVEQLHMCEAGYR